MHIAIIKTGGKQYIVKEKDLLKIEKIDGLVGDQTKFDQVLFTGDTDGNQANIGYPYLPKSSVTGTITEQKKDKKVSIIKFKSKVRYKRKTGHRQPVTVVQITNLK